MAKLKITLRKSTIGALENQIRTVKSLGLHKVGSSVVQEDRPDIRGMINVVHHLVEVQEIQD
ncbi:50S ribosomal protein L30 [Mahella australiensis]|uniref:Large ribosomal subunit protein uL30 n=1 Tax=Mahella australiensis (strain DSM 15567 / CIP 107919 / 50-1 BON) TaxID=697281 RepID=F4A2W7_MAHA5|nr:50S ribosomal protein L30 [Mahella australiensis]AEE97310.1 LSU ribosomal protein L30P [Mahella australiensis 50-1 BON]MDI3508210.1 large subunit ribosomal protein [Clostridiales bacterium]